jgi:hypothetical protein
MSRLAFWSRLRLSAEPNQIRPVFSGCNYSRLDKYFLEILITFDSINAMATSVNIKDWTASQQLGIVGI